MQPEDLNYTTTHEWLRIQDDLATIGITDHAQSELGDIVFLELPQVGTALPKGTVFGAVESVKTVSDLVAPVSGEIVDVNEEVTESPELVNEDPYVAGWLVILKMEDPSELEELMSEEQYEEFVQER